MDRCCCSLTVAPRRIFIQPLEAMTVAASEIPETVEAAPNWRPNSLSILVLLAGLILTGALAWIAVSIHDRNEDRLLNLELRQAASVVTAAVPSIQIPLTSAAELAASTNGKRAAFPDLHEVFRRPRRTLRGRIAVATGPRTSDGGGGRGNGLRPVSPDLDHSLSDQGPQRLDICRRQHAEQVAADHRLRGGSTLGHHSVGGIRREATAGEPPPESDPELGLLAVELRALPGRVNQAQPTFWKRHPTNSRSGNLATASVPFGDSAITVVATPDQELGGTLLARLPWIVAIAGAGLSLVAAVLADYLIRRRRQAEWLASENRRMYSEQRSIAEVPNRAAAPGAARSGRGGNGHSLCGRKRGDRCRRGLVRRHPPR